MNSVHARGELTDFTVLCVTNDSDLGALVQGVLATTLPSVTLLLLSREEVTAESAVGAVCMVVDGDAQQEGCIETLRHFRANGFKGAAVVLVSDSNTSTMVRAAALGAPVTVLKRDIMSNLAGAVTAAARPAASQGQWRVLYDELRETQRVLALGQLASTLRHELSNPMTVISAEAQMLAMDPSFPAAYSEQVNEILLMCRRINGVIRQLDRTASDSTHSGRLPVR